MEVRLRRTEMSKRELGRVEVLARVRSQQLQLIDAARLMRVSYRQAKRLWQRYRAEGAAGLKHRSAGQRSHRACAEKFRQKVLRLVREKYGGPVGERFGPTLAAEHLASEDGLQVDGETLRRWMLAAGLWSRERAAKAPSAARAQGALWGAGTDGREFSRVAGRARSGRLLDRHGNTGCRWRCT
jgi:transposase